MDVVLVFVRYLLARAAEIECLLHSLDCRHETKLQFLGELHILNGTVQAIKLLFGCSLEEVFAIEVVEHLAEHVELIFYNLDRLFDALKFFALKVGILLQSEVHVFLDTDIVNDQALILAFINTVYTGDSLNKSMLLNRLIDVNGIKSRYIKSGQPHVNDNGNLKVRLDVFELAVELLPIFLGTKHIKELGLVILVSRHNKLDHFDGFEFFLVGFAQFNTIRADLFLSPFRSEFDNDLVEIIGNIPVGADEHGFSGYCCAFSDAGLIVLYEILGNSSQPVWIADNHIEVCDGFLAFLDLILVCSFCGALVVVFLNLPNLVLVESDLCRTSVIDEVDCNAVTHGLSHRIGVHNTAEHLNRGVNRRSGKAYVSRIGKRVMQILCKAVCAIYSFCGNFDLLIKIDLASVSLVRNADHICSVCQKLQILGKLLNGGQINATARATAQFLAELLSRVNADHSIVADILL